LTALDLWSAWRSKDTPRRDALTNALRLPLWGLSGCVVLGVAVLVWLASHGMLGGFLELFGRITDALEYTALPTQFDAGWRLYDLRYVVLFWPAGLIAIGAYELIRGRDARDRRLAEAMLAMALLSMMVLQKQLVRPVEYTLQVPLLLATLMYGALAPRVATWRFQITKAVLVGIAIAVMTSLGRYDDLKGALIDGPRRLTSSLAILASPATNREANREIYAPARFANFEAGWHLIKEIRSRWHPDGPLTLYALSDAASLYMLTGQPTVWQSNTYNGSPVYEQDRRVEWLTATPPDFVVFDPARMTFDNIANTVRVPRVVSAVIEKYVPAGKVDTFEVLRRRQPNEPVPFAYWRDRLGDVIDLGHLPEQLDISTRGSCAASQPCDEYLSVSLDPGMGG